MNCPMCNLPMRRNKVWHPTNTLTMRVYKCAKCRENQRTQEVFIDHYQARPYHRGLMTDGAAAGETAQGMAR